MSSHVSVGDSNSSTTLPLHHEMEGNTVARDSSRGSLSKRSSTTAGAPSTAPILASQHDNYSSPDKENGKRRSSSSRSTTMNSLKEKLFSFTNGGNDHHPSQRPSIQNQRHSMDRRSSTKRKYSATTLVLLLGGLLLACCSSVLYLTTTISMEEKKDPNNAPRIDQAKTKQPPPDAQDIISKLSKPSQQQDSKARKIPSEHPRIVGLSSMERKHDINARHSIQLPAMNSTYSPERYFDVQYHRIHIPRDKLPPPRVYQDLLTPQNRSWGDVLDLPIVADSGSGVSSTTVATPPQSINTTAVNATLSTSDEEEPVRDDNMQAEILEDDTNNDDTCQPMADWMTATFSNCNTLHEIDMLGGTSQQDQTNLKLLGQGWFRGAWKYDTFVTPPNATMPVSPLSSDVGSTVILKTLRPEREFLEEYLDLHRRDAVAMERLTFSPFVIDVYGYCGQSALNEFADGVANGRFQSLEQVNRAMRGKESDPHAMRIKLQLATSISIGLAHVHNVYIGSEPGHTRRYSTSKLIYGDHSTSSTTGFGDSLATMTHYDINPRNIAMLSSGKPKFNDFNIAEFMTYNATTKESCGFRSRLHEPWWRAPEEMDMSHTAIVNEKVDVYALGNVLFHILTTHSPRGKMKKERMEEVREIVRNGTRPAMLEPYATGEIKKNRITKAFIKAMDLCYEADPAKRGTSIEVAKVLHKALKREEEEGRKSKNKGSNNAKADEKPNDKKTAVKPSK